MLAVIEPRPLIYPSEQFCSIADFLACCPFGPPSYNPPDNLESLCPLSTNCISTINTVLCDYCSPTIAIVTENNNQYIYVSQGQKDKIDTECLVVDPISMSGCNSSIFSWPNFPLKSQIKCNGTVEVLSRTGSFTDGSYPGFYENQMNCVWNFNVPFCSALVFTIDRFDTEENYDFLTFTSATSNFRLTGNLENVLQQFPDGQFTLPCQFTATFTSDMDVIFTGFTLSYQIENPIPFNYPVIMSDQNTINVLTLDDNGKLLMSPYKEDMGQYWNFTMVNNMWRINSYIYSDIVLGIDEDGSVSTLDISYLWNITADNDAWIISSEQKILSNVGTYPDTSTGTVTLSNLWHFNDGVSRNRCQSLELVLQEEMKGTISGNSGIYLYPGGLYICQIDVKILPGSKTDIVLRSLGLAKGDFLQLHLSDDEDYIYQGSILSYLDNDFVTGITVDRDFFVKFSVQTGFQRGFDIDYVVHCDRKCRSINRPNNLSPYLNFFCENAEYSPGPTCLFQDYISDEEGVIDDGSGLLPYKSATICNWNLRVPNAAALAFYFCLFDTEYTFDYVYIIDLNENSTGIVSFTGSRETGTVPSSVLIRSNFVAIKFFSDLTISTSGFHIYYTSLYAPDISCDCEQLCLNTWNGTYCTCYDGYFLAAEKKSCTDINECSTGICNNAHDCKNYPGYYECLCDDGFILSSIDDYCIEINECALGTHNCEEYCHNTNGSYYCACGAPKILSSDGRSCLDVSAPFPITPVFSLSFCNPQNLSSSNSVISRLGCDAVPFSGNSTQKCIFPFVFQNETYNQCINIGFRKGERKDYWCAISVNENFEVLERGYCDCSPTRNNVVFKTPAFNFVSDEPERLNDGNKNDNKDEVYFMQQDEWYTIFNDWQQVKSIRFYGCPSCYTSVEYFTLTLRLLTDVFSFEVPVWSTELGIRNNFVEFEFFLPPEVGQARVVDISTSNFLYVAEIEVYADNFNIQNLSLIDGSLVVSRKSNPFISRPLTEEEESSTIVQYPNEVTINEYFMSSFRFAISPNSVDTFSLILSDSSLNNGIMIGFNTAEGKLFLQSYSQDTYKLIDSVTQSDQTGYFTDGNDHYCSVVYQPDTDSFNIYFDNVNPPLISTTIDLATIVGAMGKIGFSASSNTTLSFKRVIDSNPGTFTISWWDFMVQKPDDNALVDDGPPIIAIIIGCVVGFIILASLVILILYLLCRQTNIAVANLPSDIRRHFKQYSVNPRPWTLVGDINQSHAYIKKLRPGTKGARRLEGLWLEMGGAEIKWTEAYAIHNMILLNGFATKHTNLTSQVTLDPKNFMKDHWKDLSDPAGVRAWTKLQYDRWVNRFVWNEGLSVKIVPAIHGTSEEIANSIVKTGFVALSKLDSGYYGKGIYFTTSVEYALPYFATKPSPSVIIFLVISGNVYPIIEHPKIKGSFMGAPLVPGYHSHYVLTRKDGYPCHKILSRDEGEEYFDELVIEQEASILPFYFLKISTANLANLAIQFQKQQEQLRKEEAIRLTSFHSEQEVVEVLNKAMEKRKESQFIVDDQSESLQTGFQLLKRISDSSSSSNTE